MDIVPLKMLGSNLILAQNLQCTQVSLHCRQISSEVTSPCEATNPSEVTNPSKFINPPEVTYPSEVVS
jgi:hypothetical protein